MKRSYLGPKNFISLSTLYLNFSMQIYGLFTIKNPFLLMKVMASWKMMVKAEFILSYLLQVSIYQFCNCLLQSSVVVNFGRLENNYIVTSWLLKYWYKKLKLIYIFVQFMQLLLTNSIQYNIYWGILIKPIQSIIFLCSVITRFICGQYIYIYIYILIK